MIAVVPVRTGVLPSGALESIAECDGRVLLVGSGLDTTDLAGSASEILLLDLGEFEVGRWAQQIAATLATLPDSARVVLPNSPDGRDLAPRLAIELGCPLLAGATAVGPNEVIVARRGGRELHVHRSPDAFVATLQPGVSDRAHSSDVPVVTVLPIPGARAVDDVEIVEVLPPDVRTMDLSEASRIVGGGAGLDGEDRFVQLAAVAVSVGATMGATRVITDRAWIHHDKQIGTTGVMVDPELYLSFGISGAVQHTAGLGHPDHIISVNKDPHCPMMQMSDLAIVSDANATIDALAAILDGAVRVPEGAA